MVTSFPSTKMSSFFLSSFDFVQFFMSSRNFVQFFFVRWWFCPVFPLFCFALRVSRYGERKFGLIISRFVFRARGLKKKEVIFPFFFAFRVSYILHYISKTVHFRGLKYGPPLPNPTSFLFLQMTIARSAKREIDFDVAFSSWAARTKILDRPVWTGHFCLDIFNWTFLFGHSWLGHCANWTF